MWRLIDRAFRQAENCRAMANVIAIRDGLPLSEEQRRVQATQNEVQTLFNRQLGAFAGAFETQAMWLGSELGWYECLASSSTPISAQTLAERTQTSPDYARDWCEYQTLTGWITCEDLSVTTVEDRRYYLSPVQLFVLSRTENYGKIAANLGNNLEAMKQAFQEDIGIRLCNRAPNMPSAVRDNNRETSLGSEIIPQALPELHNTLSQQHGRVAVVSAAGFVWSSINVAQSYPLVHVDYFDNEPTAIDAATTNEGDIAAANVEDRVQAHLIDYDQLDDGIDTSSSEPYDLVVAPHNLNGCGSPVNVLRWMKILKRTSDGVVLIPFDPPMGQLSVNTVDPGVKYSVGVQLLGSLPDNKAFFPNQSIGIRAKPSFPQLDQYIEEAGYTTNVVHKDASCWYAAIS
jgi:hypothetical protein